MPAVGSLRLPTRRQVPAIVAGLVALIVLLAVLVVWNQRHPAPRTAKAALTASLKELPARPEDIEAHGVLAQSVLDADDARKRNAAVPFATGAVVPARAFVFSGSAEDRTRALACLSTAVLYEAGDDVGGEEAVAQVVLNRVRHPAFPGTVCGVVYQGSQRSTGCQFTFTCDGSLRRSFPDAAWRRSREVAERALSGAVDGRVGLATHYHTNWVYPYWSPELRKLGQVGTHLFFGWPGSWGGQGAFARRYRGGEAVVGLSALGPGVMASNAAIVGDSVPGGQDSAIPGIGGFQYSPARLPAKLANTPLYGNRVRLVREDGRAFGLLAGPDATGTKLVNTALSLCAEPGPCQVQAWTNEDDIPGAYPIPSATRDTMVFEYVRDESGSQSAVRFDCERFPNKDPKRCLRFSPEGPSGLSGVRRKVK
jgi:spore germination cell wall hydrolase CwlJ-like protein